MILSKAVLKYDDITFEPKISIEGDIPWSIFFNDYITKDEACRIIGEMIFEDIILIKSTGKLCGMKIKLE